MEKSADAFRTISEVAEDLRLPQHVLRFWETRFPQIRPLKRAGGRRYYRPADTVLLRTIRQLLYEEGYTIKGVQRLLKEQGVRRLSGEGSSLGAEPRLVEDPDDEDDADGLGPGGAEAIRDPLEHDGDGQAPSSLDALFAVFPDARPYPARAASPFAVPDPRVVMSEGDGALREALAIVEECIAILQAVR